MPITGEMPGGGVGRAMPRRGETPGGEVVIASSGSPDAPRHGVRSARFGVNRAPPAVQFYIVRLDRVCAGATCL